MKPNILQESAKGTEQNPNLQNLIVNGNFTRPAQSGKTNYSHLFPEAKVKIDACFKELLQTLGNEYSDEERNYQSFETKPGANHDTAIIYGLNITRFTTAAELRANVEFLGTTEEGKKLLEIPEGEDEVNLILGYTDERGTIMVHFVEHEFEDNEREVHFHSRPLNVWRNDNPKGIAPKE